MKTIITDKGTFLFIEVARYGVIFYTAFGYLMYDVHDESTGVTDEELTNPYKLRKALKRTEGKSGFQKATPIKLPEGEWEFLCVIRSGLLDRHEASQNITEEKATLIVGDNGMNCYDNYKGKIDERYTCTSAMESFSALLMNSGLSTDLESNYAILKFKVQ